MLRLFCVITIMLLFTACSPILRMSSTSQQVIVWEGIVAIDGDYVIPEGVTVVVRPGTRIQFVSPGANSDLLQSHPYFVGSELIVRGKIIAEGTASEPIRFSADSVNKGAGSWGGVNIEGGRATFLYCIFTQADSAIHARDSQVMVRESYIDNNIVGLRFHSTDMLAENNTISDNGAGIRFHFGSPTIRFNRITDNEKGFFITDSPKNYTIEQNVIRNSTNYHVVLGEPVVDDVSFQSNCWLPSVGEQNRSLIFDKGVDGYLGRVMLAPSCLDIDARGASWQM